MTRGTRTGAFGKINGVVKFQEMRNQYKIYIWRLNNSLALLLLYRRQFIAWIYLGKSESKLLKVSCIALHLLFKNKETKPVRRRRKKFEWHTMQKYRANWQLWIKARRDHSFGIKARIFSIALRWMKLINSECASLCRRIPSRANKVRRNSLLIAFYPRSWFVTGRTHTRKIFTTRR